MVQRQITPECRRILPTFGADLPFNGTVTANATMLSDLHEHEFALEVRTIASRAGAPVSQVRINEMSHPTADSKLSCCETAKAEVLSEARNLGKNLRDNMRNV